MTAKPDIGCVEQECEECDRTQTSANIPASRCPARASAALSSVTDRGEGGSVRSYDGQPPPAGSRSSLLEADYGRAMKRPADDEAVLGVVGTVVYRLARREDDEALAGLDGSFTTDSVFEVTVAGGEFRIRETPVAPPVHKTFPDEDGSDDDDGDPELSRTVVAFDGDELCGFIETSFDPWNARLTICDIEVAPAWRGKGVGRTLMNHAFDCAKELGARHVWLEVTNINAPAVRAYLRMGFTFCGLDTTLYDGTASTGEQALFMSRRVR
ncbi:GNAT family N-acetyltransferase [Streptomyces spinoverrucosus]|uniref:GNAT family N-acetyltransferase n=1 Tax=Streptomyces spinoverrucosus TaxID=284043 RepID=UPI00280BDB00|nr:GNAT family N-acetyltransferase [Streptomyces spinoverrucosus]